MKLQKTSLKTWRQVLLSGSVQIFPWTDLIVIARASPFEQLRSGFFVNRPDCNWARKSNWMVPFRFFPEPAWLQLRAQVQLNRSVKVFSWTDLIVIARASPIEQLPSGFALNRPDCGASGIRPVSLKFLGASLCIDKIWSWLKGRSIRCHRKN